MTLESVEWHRGYVQVRYRHELLHTQVHELLWSQFSTDTAQLINH